MTIQDWLNDERTINRSKKSYAHFDCRTDIGQQRAYISSAENVAAHGFYPFIHYEQRMKKFSKEKGPRVKTRDICYAAHIDRCIYQLYSFILNEQYNERVLSDGISDIAVAYRTNLHKSNIDFSKQAFDFIRRLGCCYVMIGDFTHFFDNLDHEYLKQRWCSLMSCTRLPADHFAVFKNITAYSKWELADLLLLNGLQDTRSDRKKLNSQMRVLSPEEFKANRSHISKNRDCFGIPQGSPISAVLANVYMLDVDKQINDLISDIGGMYMRYSDDFIVIIPDSENILPSHVFDQVCKYISGAPRLTLEPSKTQYFHYCTGTLDNCGKEFHQNADESSRFINFLGFSFDGEKISIRSKTVSKYYYRMYRKAKNIALHGGYTPSGKHISGENLYRRYSERGATGKTGNFLSYVSRAQKKFGSGEAITRDTKRHMQKIRKALKKRK